MVVMLAQHVVTLPYPSELVAAVFADPEHRWTVGLDGDGREHLARVGVRIGRMPIYKHVRLILGSAPIAIEADRLMLFVDWEATGGPPLFPRMQGTLHINPVEAGVTRLTLNASYDPPLGPLGDLIDRALMHRVAQATVEDLLERLAIQVDEEVKRGSRPPARPPV
jgi:hypothetical protein